MRVRVRRTITAAVVTAVTAAVVVVPGHPVASAAATPFVATLATHANTASSESAAGLKVGMLEVQWNRFEPRRGQVDQGYALGIKAQFDKLHAAGMRVTLGLGLHFTPAWLTATKSNHLVDNHGNYSSQVDFVFNRAVRARANWYLQQLDAVIGLQNAWAVRLTSGSSSELLYPSGSYWAYSPGAQGGPRPKTLAANPRPGWKPGQPATVAQRRTWAHWYVGALADVVDWQIDTVYTLGFRGYYQVVTPGQGLRPKQWNALMDKGLYEGLLGRGAAWYVLYAHLRHRKNVTVYVSSVADGTADSSVCTTADKAVALDDPAAYLWSGARWLSRVARGLGLTVAGEPPGYPTAAAGRAHYSDRTSAGLLAVAMRQATACGFLGLYWAHDDQVWSGAMPLSHLATVTSADATPPALAPR